MWPFIGGAASVLILIAAGEIRFHRSFGDLLVSVFASAETALQHVQATVAKAGTRVERLKARITRKNFAKT